MPGTIGRLHVLTDFHFQQRWGHADLAERAIRGGADVVQFREKHGTVRSKLYELRSTAAVCRASGTVLIVDDHLDLALAVGAAGVHLGQEDLPVAAARRMVADDFIIGATASTIAEARLAEREGADYIGFGPVFRTGSKPNPKPVRGLDGLASVCAAVGIPVIAIAGITPARVGAIIEAGAHGVAVMSAVTTAADVERATAAFRDAIDLATSRTHATSHA